VKTIVRALPHVVIVLAGIVLVLAILDRTNPSMAYLSNEGTRGLILALCVVSIVNAIVMLLKIAD
jgi:hypothetical protein